MNHNNKTIRHIAKSALCCVLLSIVTSNAQAIILYSGDNSANLTAPDTARTDIFNSVAKITNADGTGIVGSAVHIKGKYLLTAQHVLYKDVTPRRTHVSFDGTTYWAIDLNFLPRQIDTADLVLFKLIEDPNLPETQLYSSSNELNNTGTLIGWGYGRDPLQSQQSGTLRVWNIDPSNYSTITKRWGTNTIAPNNPSLVAEEVDDIISTELNSNGGNSEAAFAYFDSGAGLFLQDGIDNIWKLAGVAFAVTSLDDPNPPPENYVPETARFSNLPSLYGGRDVNLFVRISAEKILSALSGNDSLIPDTSTYSGWAIDNSLYGTDAETTADPDGDGLNNQTEFNLGSDPNDSDTSNDGLSDQALVDYGLDPNVDHTLLYNAIVQSIADLRAGSTIIEVINNQATITLNLESSDDLVSWTQTGDTATLQVPTSNDTQFYRFKLSD